MQQAACSPNGAGGSDGGQPMGAGLPCWRSRRPFDLACPVLAWPGPSVLTSDRHMRPPARADSDGASDSEWAKATAAKRTQGSEMRPVAYRCYTCGNCGPEVLEVEADDPAPLGDDEVLLHMSAAGVNRADALRPPPAACGRVTMPEAPVLSNLVCKLLTGGGYVKKLVVLAGHLLPGRGWLT